MVTQRVGTSGGAIWMYNSADAATAVRAAGYITNASDLGMKIGDIVIQSDATGGTVGNIYQVNSVTAGGAADLTDGTAITATDTD